MSCRYVNTLKAEFGRKISAEEANEQFNAIETAMACLEQLANSGQSGETVSHNYGSVSGSTILDPSLGNMQFVTIQGDVNLGFEVPGDADPKVIYLLIEDGGNGRFKFPTGTAWTTLSHGASISGKPWDSMGLGGNYGAVVVCIYDNLGWVYLCYGRNDINFAVAPEAVDLYGWR